MSERERFRVVVNDWLSSVWTDTAPEDLLTRLDRAGLTITPGPGYDHSGNDNHLVAGDHGPVITPQAGEAEPHAWVYEFDDPDPQTDIEFGAECPEGWKRHIARGAVYPLYRTAPPRPVGPTAGDILISRDAAMTVLARWVYDEHWMKASDDMLAVAVQPSPVAPVWQPKCDLYRVGPYDTKRGGYPVLRGTDGASWGLFITRDDATDWARYRNCLIDIHGTDTLPSPPNSPGAETSHE